MSEEVKMIIRLILGDVSMRKSLAQETEAQSLLSVVHRILDNLEIPRGEDRAKLLEELSK